MTDDDDLLTFAEDDGVPRGVPSINRWKVAIIDDDAAIHDGTRFALYDYSLNGQELELLSAHSAKEGRELLQQHPDMAAVLLDVVMESDTAGLELVDYIRTTLKNEMVRIILRTGQPGQAPERRVIVDYDINDYEAKTELTADKLFTSLTAALRSFQQLQRMAETRRGLEIIIEAASTLFDFKSMQRLAEGVLTQMASLLAVDCAGILVLRETAQGQESLSVLAGSGIYRQLVSDADRKGLDPALRDIVQRALVRRSHEFQDRRSVLYVETGSGRQVVVVLEADKTLVDTDRALVEVFCSRMSIAFDNVILYEQLQSANSDLEERVVQRTRELTSANRRLEAQWRRLRSANAFKSEILGTVAHDLKNPLSVILGRTEILSDLAATEPVPVDKIGGQLGHIHDSAQRLTRMVDNLIADAMADALDITIRREPIDVATLVGEVVAANRDQAARKDQTVRLASAPSPATCDQDRIREALDNLMSNAIKYSPSGGSVDVDVDHKDAHVVIRVRDSGPGFSPEDASRLFNRFQRLSAKPTGGEGSTGLGLSIVKRIVDLHGGEITVANASDGPGAVFTIRLPVEAPGARA